MYLARILYPVKVLGPGNRIGIWFDGCPHHCRGCSNPELWDTQEKYKTTLEVFENLLDKICSTHSVDGFTLTGGDPFAQPEALEEILPVLSNISNDILVYTGFQYEELKTLYPKQLSQIGVLIDGPYIEERNIGIPLCGSDNQQIIILNPALTETYATYLRDARNTIQDFTTMDGVISVGIHNPDYNTAIDKLLQNKGLEHISDKENRNERY